MEDHRARNSSSPPSPSPPRNLMATPVPGSPSPIPLIHKPKEQLETISTLTLIKKEPRPVVNSHFRLKWKQNETTGLMTLVSETSVSPLVTSAANSDDSENEDEKDGAESTITTKTEAKPFQDWRNKERMRTTGVAIILCLNLGTDPPDIDRVPPFARTECGIDPSRYHGEFPTYEVLKSIADHLRNQFRSLQPRADIQLAPDPTVEKIRKTCIMLRKKSISERVLVHFNGHGVPRPTRNGEIWAFNEDFTQYIPLSIFDLVRWAGHPSMFTFDCQSAGQLIPHFQEHERENERRYKQQLDEWRRNRVKRKKEQERRDRRERENERLVMMARAQNSVMLAAAASGTSAAIVASQDSRSNGEVGGRQDQVNGVDGAGMQSTDPNEGKPVRKRIIVLVPCGPEENLPSSPHLPADLFTCCLTMPIQTALRWFIMQNRMTMEPLGIDQNIVDLIPGSVDDKKSMLGELKWIFTAITDTIAWSVLPRKMFQRLFRQDLLVASMLRHFLLADRIFRSLGCTPDSIPSLPSTWKHKMWDTWEQIVESLLIQLPSVIPPNVLMANGFNKAARISAERRLATSVPRAPSSSPIARYEEEVRYEPHFESRFVQDQLKAFEMWLSSQASSSALVRRPPSVQTAPDQLPIILQVLLSFHHRSAVLEPLSQFLDLGPWAVFHALSVGMFPYLLKLLENPSSLKNFLVRAWVRILDLDPTCREGLNEEKKQEGMRQQDGLNEEKKHTSFFIRELSSTEDADHKARSALVLCIVCDGYADAKIKCLKEDLDKSCITLLQQNGRDVSFGSNYLVENAVEADQKLGSSESDDGGADTDSESSSDERAVRSKSNGNHQTPPFLTDGSSSHNIHNGRKPQLDQKNVNLMRWCCLLLATLWDGFDFARSRAVGFGMHRVLERLLMKHEHLEIREAAAFALGRLLGPLMSISDPSRHAGAPTSMAEERSKPQEMGDSECDLAVRLLKTGRHDGSPLVRREIVLAVSRFVMDQAHLGNFQLIVHFLSEYRQKPNQTQPALIDQLQGTFGMRGPKYMAIWLDLTRVFAVDPFPAVSQAAQILIRFVKGGVEARIEAIRGRAGEGMSAISSTPRAMASILDTSLSLPTVALESDLFERSKRQMCRSSYEVEVETLAEETAKELMSRNLIERSRASATWSRECSNWIGPKECCDWWYSMEDVEGNYTTDLEEGIDSTANRSLKAPFLQLLRSQQLLNGSPPHVFVPANSGFNTTGNALGKSMDGYAKQSSGATDLAGTPPDMESEMVRRFDRLPVDLFSASSATHKLRRSSSVQSQLQLQRQTSVSQASTSQLQPSNSSRSLGNRLSSLAPSKMEETCRIDLSKFGLGGNSNHSNRPYIAMYHPFLPDLVVAHQQTITCFDCNGLAKTGSSPQLASRFSNLNIAPTTLSSIAWVDAQTDPVLLTYADDGHVRVWRSPVTPSPQLASAFSPFDMSTTGTVVLNSSNSHMSLLEWVSPTSQLICSQAQSSALRVWDIISEKLVSELVCGGPSGAASSSATCLSSSDTLPYFGAGFSDGSVRLFDQRANGRFSSVTLKSAGTGNVAIANLSRISSNYCLSSVSERGDVKVWDVRMDEGEIRAHTEMRAEGQDCIYAFHPNAPILAYAQRKASPSTLKLLALDDSDLGQVPLKLLQASSSAFGFMGSSKQVRQVCALAWHPLELSLTVGTTDSLQVFIASNTRVRGTWSPQDMRPATFASLTTQQSSAAFALNGASSGTAV